ncbi:MAG TPA: DUF423 domain-containing protein [Vicinamibacterales bacterium]
MSQLRQIRDNMVTRRSIGLLVVSVLPRTSLVSSLAATWVRGLLVVGIVLFSGRLYLLAVSGLRMLGAITPIGGVAFVAAWLIPAWAFVRP